MALNLLGNRSISSELKQFWRMAKEPGESIRMTCLKVAVDLPLDTSSKSFYLLMWSLMLPCKLCAWQMRACRQRLSAAMMLQKTQIKMVVEGVKSVKVSECILSWSCAATISASDLLLPPISSPGPHAWASWLNPGAFSWLWIYQAVCDTEQSLWTWFCLSVLTSDSMCTWTCHHDSLFLVESSAFGVYPFSLFIKSTWNSHKSSENLTSESKVYPEKVYQDHDVAQQLVPCYMDWHGLTDGSLLLQSDLIWVRLQTSGHNIKHCLGLFLE